MGVHGVTQVGGAVSGGSAHCWVTSWVEVGANLCREPSSGLQRQSDFKMHSQLT